MPVVGAAVRARARMTSCPRRASCRLMEPPWAMGGLQSMKSANASHAQVAEGRRHRQVMKRQRTRERTQGGRAEGDGS